MKLKKQSIILIGVLAVVFVLVFLGQLVIYKQANISLPTFKARELPTLEISSKSEESITVDVDFNDGNKLSGEVEAGSVYEALERLAKKNGIKVEAKQYKYGLLVEKIGQKQNSKDFFWSYSVNGKVGNIACDRYLVYPGDRVEWKYSKITQ